MTKTIFKKPFCGLFYPLANLISLLINSGAKGAKNINDEIHGFYEPSSVQYVFSKESLPTAVIASPFGLEKDLSLLTFLHFQDINQPQLYPKLPQKDEVTAT